ncbi:MAG: MlaD family protein [Candidatus Omnitrophica bacterium]|nr:MlaD family protein [Candidatus Omnitrophota bacterium]
MRNDKEQKIKFWAGLFFIVGILAIASVILTIGIERGLTEPKFEVTVLFHNVGGMNEGAPIRLSGVNVGHVKSIQFLPEEVSGRALKVKLSIFVRYRAQLGKASNFAIRNEGVLGEKLVEIETDPKATGMDLTKPILGEDPFDIEDSVRAVTTTAKSFQETSDQLNLLVQEMQAVTHKSKRLLNRMEERVVEGTLFKVF